MGPRLETFTDSAIFRVFDRMYKVVLINLLVLLTLVVGLVVLSHMLALVILVLAIRAFDSPSEYSMVNTWIRLVKRHALPTFRLSLPFAFTTLLMAFDAAYFHLAWRDRGMELDLALSIFFLVLFLWSILATVNGAFLYVFFPHLDLRAIWKHAFLLPRIVPLETLVVLLGIGLGVVWFYLSPIVLTLLWPALVIGLYHWLIRSKMDRLTHPASPPICWDDVYLSSSAESNGSPRLPHARSRERDSS
jgi:uncharacterized membrane protein YesL